MKKIAALMMLLLFALAGCSQSPASSSAQLTKATETAQPDSPACADVSGIWLGTHTIGDTVFDTGYILEQEGCQVTGQEALYREYDFSTDLICDFQDDHLTCDYQSTLDDCNYKLDLQVSSDSMQGFLNSCMLDNAPVALAHADQAELAAWDEKMENISYAPTQSVCAVAAALPTDGDAVFCDQFDDNSNAWQVGSAASDMAVLNVQIEGGKLKVNATGKATSGYQTGVLQWLSPFTSAAGDYMLQASGKIDSNFKGSGWGIAFNGDYLGIMNAPSFYVLVITNSGDFTLQKLADNKMTPVIAPRAHNMIKIGEQNTISILKRGESYEFYSNGELIAAQELPPLEGNDMMVAFFVNEGVVADYEMDDFLLNVTPGE